MQATFVEFSEFSRWRSSYLDDDAFAALQLLLMERPEAGAVIPGTGGLRKLRAVDLRRHKGKRGGLRVIYFWWAGGAQVWLYAIYDKDEADDLSSDDRAALKAMLKAELLNRKRS